MPDEPRERRTFPVRHALTEQRVDNLSSIDGCPYSVSEEDLLRAQCYALLGRLLASKPDQKTLELCKDLEGDETEIGQAISLLSDLASKLTPEAISDEFDALFVGMTHGELQPYASYYLTGFLHEKPLADLRGDMRRLGIQRAEDVAEPEDHIASLCEMMHGLTTGVFGEPADIDAQQKFFDAHIGTWAPKFFEDLESAKNAVFYVPVGRIGRQFIAIETEAFAMAA